MSRAPPGDTSRVSYSDNWPQGQCTWRVALYYMIPWSGNAKDWISGAESHGWQVSNQPHIGDIAVYQPGDNGAASDGHVAIVTSINSDGQTYRVWEQNVTFGTAAPDSRTVNLGTGTEFITPPVSARTDQFSQLFTDAAAVGGPASSNAQLTGLDANPFNLFGIPGTIIGGVASPVTSAIGTIANDVFVFAAKSGEVLIGLALMTVGVFILISQTGPGAKVTTNVTSAVKQGAKEAAVAAA